MDSLCICYNLVDHSLSKIPLLPEAYVVPITNGHLGYVEKQATPETLESYEIIFHDTPHEQLLEICSSLKIKALEQQFMPVKRRKSLTFSDVLKDPKINEVVLSYISKKLSVFYSLIVTNQYAITSNAQRKDPFENHKLSIGNTILKPILEFTKIDEGIEYAFSLKNKDTLIIPKNNDIQILLNEPSWIIVDKYLYQIENLNANKLKPFFDKEKITIAQKHIKIYLEKVIIPIIKNVDVITHGFDIITHQDIASYGIEIIRDFIQDTYVIKVIFEYDTILFDYNSTKTTVSNVHFKDDDQIQIIQTKRNPEAEQEIIDLLISKGLQVNNNLLLETKVSDDPFEILNWLTLNKEQLEADEFEIKLPLLDDRTVNIDAYTIEIGSQQENDWFDIKGVVAIGNQEIPFSKFITHIKQNNRFFPIGDDEVFIIPKEWMTRYKKLVDFGQIQDKNIRITKSNYILLKDIIPPEEISIEDATSHHYEPSSKLKATLRPYQEKGVQWLVNHHYNKLGACLADDMGLGKTLQTIAMLVYAKEQLEPIDKKVEKIRLDLFIDPLEVKTYLKALIVLPSSLVFNWAQEIIKFAPHLNIVKYIGPDRKKITPYLETYDIILTTYTTVSKDITALEKINFTYLITDESQQIKNKESKIFQAINNIHTTHKISLSGTPIENSLSDLWSQMEFINPGMLGSYPFFKDRFKIPIEKHQDPECIKELKTLIDPFILRRTKEQVAKDLPKLSEQTIYTEMLPEQEKQYESQKSAARNLLLGIDAESTNKIHILNTLTKLRQIVNHPKLIDNKTKDPSGKFQDVTHYLETLVKANKKVLVFSSFVSHLDLYQEWCREHNISYVTLTGQTKGTDREAVVYEFQKNDAVSLFFISLKAGGVGLNLTKASYVVLLDPWWNPFIEKQAIARSHRIGQTNNVMVTRFITKNTIEEKILQLQEKKKGLSDEIIDINAIPQYIEQNLEELLE
ncbi:non-specific serine/threonine protein kinase [Aquimarina sp. MAR_2010_214]|uniref:DEAD/DEAH box helicase n=1 Tax=Aquimarina sp. MAR_2010_214 TaxID=1250026 RepID=UPI000C70271C|nr:DEAD/DEAH box helicase [Aquimarina sp. MAR_2010_214]PKV49601.1 non-specific serine/threonine protein kinase [Aquimarina sp. MAR_2010_214]